MTRDESMRDVWRVCGEEPGHAIWASDHGNSCPLCMAPALDIPEEAQAVVDMNGNLLQMFSVDAAEIATHGIVFPLTVTPLAMLRLAFVPDEELH